MANNIKGTSFSYFLSYYVLAIVVSIFDFHSFDLLDRAHSYTTALPELKTWQILNSSTIQRWMITKWRRQRNLFIFHKSSHILSLSISLSRSIFAHSPLSSSLSQFHHIETNRKPHPNEYSELNRIEMHSVQFRSVSENQFSCQQIYYTRSTPANTNTNTLMYNNVIFSVDLSFSLFWWIEKRINIWWSSMNKSIVTLPSKQKSHRTFLEIDSFEVRNNIPTHRKVHLKWNDFSRILHSFLQFIKGNWFELQSHTFQYYS